MFAYVLLGTLLAFCFNFCLSKFLSKSQASIRYSFHCCEICALGNVKSWLLFLLNIDYFKFAM